MEFDSMNSGHTLTKVGCFFEGVGSGSPGLRHPWSSVCRVLWEAVAEMELGMQVIYWGITCELIREEGD